MIRVAQVGTFDVDNLGDLLFPVVMERILAELAAELNVAIECTAFGPKGIAAGALYADQLGCLPLEQLARLDAQTPFDLIFVGGGDIVRDDDESLMSTYGWERPGLTFSALSSPVATAQRRLVLLAPGVPSTISPTFEALLANSYKRVRHAGMRDQLSAQRIADLIPSDVDLQIVPDIVAAIAHYFPKPALLARDNPLVPAALRSRGYICVQLHSLWCANLELTAKTLRQIERDTGIAVLLMETEFGREEVGLAARLAQQYSFAITRRPQPNKAGGLMDRVALIAGARGVVAASLHAVVLAHAYGVPHFNYAGSALSKIRGFYQDRAGGRMFSTFAQLRAHLPEICAVIGGARTGAGEPVNEHDHAGIRRFVRRALISALGDPPSPAADYRPEIDLQYRRFQQSQLELRVALAERNAQMGDIAGSFLWLIVCALRGMLERRPRLRLAALAVAKALRRDMDCQWLSNRRRREEIAGTRPHVCSPAADHAIAVPLAWAHANAPITPSVAVACHLYFDEMAGEFRCYLSHLPFRADLYLTTDTEDKRRRLAREFADWNNGEVNIRIVENRGRDIAAKLIACADAHRNHDYVLHIHSKRSDHLRQLDGWRRYLLNTLLGSRETVASIFAVFATLPKVGMIAPMHFEPIRRGLGWGRNFGLARDIATRLGLNIDIGAAMDFPSGSMFWARSASLKPLLDLGLSASDFPAEQGQKDGTSAHAIERLYYFVCEAAGYDWLHVARPQDVRPATNSVVYVRTPADLQDAYEKYRIRLTDNRG